MGAGDAESRFAINLDSNASEVAPEAAAQIEELRQRISGSTDAVKQASAAMRSLRGSTDEVKAAKEQLRARIEAERTALSSANLAILKHGTTYEAAATQARKLAAEKKELDARLKADAIERAKASTEAMGNAIKVAGGPVEGLKGRFEQLEGVLGGAGGAMGALTLVISGAVAAIGLAIGAVVGLTSSFVRWVVTAADAARSMGLVREAAAGSAANAHNLGTQVDALAAKVPTAKSALNDLAVRLDRTRLSGQAIVDTFNLVGQASSAMGDEVGKQLQDIVTRGQLTQRLQINPLELQGTGLQFKDIAGQLSKQMGIGVKDAEAALFEGRVKLDAGAKALRAAVEARFGEINARKLLSLDVQIEKFKEKLGALAADVHIEPLLKSIDKLSHLFDQTTVSGAALKQLVTLFGDQLGPVFTAASPIVSQFFKGLVIGALRVTIAFLKLKSQLKETFAGAGGDIDLVNLALKGAIAPLEVIARVLKQITLSLALLKGAKDAIDTKGIGGAITDGVAGGVKAGEGALTKVVGGLADKVKAAFKGALGIQSPSKVFASFGENTVAGFAGGVRASSREASAAVGSMATEVAVAGATASASAPGGASMAMLSATPPAPGEAASSGRSQAAAPVVNVEINVTGGGGQDVAKQLSDPSFLAQLTQALRDALISAGVPTEAT